MIVRRTNNLIKLACHAGRQMSTRPQYRHIDYVKIEQKRAPRLLVKNFLSNRQVESTCNLAAPNYVWPSKNHELLLPYRTILVDARQRWSEFKNSVRQTCIAKLEVPPIPEEVERAMAEYHMNA